MEHLRFRSLITTCALAVAAHGAQAQALPPIKPGLWQIHMEREVNGLKAPDMSERMKGMSPETRAKIEAAMKQQGIDAGAAGMRKACYSREMIERGGWADQEGACKTDFSSRGATSWKWHSSCPQLGYEGDGEAIFSDSENYVVKSTGVTNTGGKVRTSSSTITAKWLGSDCGDLKPLQARP